MKKGRHRRYLEARQFKQQAGAGTDLAGIIPPGEEGEVDPAAREAWADLFEGGDDEDDEGEEPSEPEPS